MENIIRQSDGELIYMIRCGSSEAFQLLSCKYERIIKGYVTSFFQDTHIYGFETIDIIQECLITFYDVLLCFNEEKGSFYSYVMKCVRYRLYDLIKESMSNKSVGFNYTTTQLLRKSEIDKGAKYMGVDYYPAGEEITHPKSAFMLQEAITNIFGDESVLTEVEKRIISLRVMGYTIEEIATKCNLGKKKVDYIIKNIRRKIKDNYLIEN